MKRQYPTKMVRSNEEKFSILTQFFGVKEIYSVAKLINNHILSIIKRISYSFKFIPNDAEMISDGASSNSPIWLLNASIEDVCGSIAMEFLCGGI